MARVVHFEIHASDPQAAAQFYTSVFGWKITKWDGPIEYWMVATGETEPGINGGIVPRRGEAPVSGAATNAYVCTIGVDSLDEMIAAIIVNGGEVAVDKYEVPGVGWLAYFKDLDGNIFGVMQPI